MSLLPIPFVPEPQTNLYKTLNTANIRILIFNTEGGNRKQPLRD